MLKNILYSLLFSTVALMALETGDSVPQNIQDRLKLESDKVYVVDFFASWCKSCKKELPLITNVYNEKIAEVIGINVDKNQEDGEKFVKELELAFPIVYDSDKSLVETFNPLGFPAVYYVKNGQILNVIFGAVEEIDKKIKEDIKAIK
ncbi:MAG: TlpA family protein disulfide reductase [Sulfurovum sp.]|nr:MAG: TlpA family protein disulfide reductase [Sulfurovum sp.]